jgi:hypothetical protein
MPTARLIEFPCPATSPSRHYYGGMLLGFGTMHSPALALISCAYQLSSARDIASNDYPCARAFKRPTISFGLVRP